MQAEGSKSGIGLLTEEPSKDLQLKRWGPLLTLGTHCFAHEAVLNVGAFKWPDALAQHSEAHC